MLQSEAGAPALDIGSTYAPFGMTFPALVTYATMVVVLVLVVVTFIVVISKVNRGWTPASVPSKTEAVAEPDEDNFDRVRALNWKWLHEMYVETHGRNLESLERIRYANRVHLTTGIIFSMLALFVVIGIMDPIYALFEDGFARSAPALVTSEAANEPVEQAALSSLELYSVPQSHWIQRFLAAVFLEVIGFFFLRLYRTGLDAMRYYQNEITNLQARRSALLLANTNRDNKQLIANLCLALVVVDRNVPLKQGERLIRLFESDTTESRSALGELADTVKAGRA